MKTLIVYYSRTGVTRTVAEALGERLAADVEEIRDAKKRTGALGSLGAGKDAMMRRLTEISEATHDPAGYDLVVIGTPVWAFTMAPAVRTYLAKHGHAVAKAASFCTMGGSGDKRTFQHVSELLGKKPTATLALLEKEVRSGAFAEKLDGFVAALGEVG